MIGKHIKRGTSMKSFTLKLLAILSVSASALFVGRCNADDEKSRPPNSRSALEPSQLGFQDLKSIDIRFLRNGVFATPKGNFPGPPRRLELGGESWIIAISSKQEFLAIVSGQDIKVLVSSLAKRVLHDVKELNEEVPKLNSQKLQIHSLESDSLAALYRVHVETGNVSCRSHGPGFELDRLRLPGDVRLFALCRDQSRCFIGYGDDLASITLKLMLSLTTTKTGASPKPDDGHSDSKRK